MEPMNEHTNGGHEARKNEIPVTPPVTPVVEVKSGPSFDAKDVEENKFVAALSYLPPFFLVPLFLKRESPFAQFHAKQGLVLAIVFCFGPIVFWVPIFGWALAIFFLVVDVMALIRTLQGEAWEIPLVKDAVKKINL